MVTTLNLRCRHSSHYTKVSNYYFGLVAEWLNRIMKVSIHPISTYRVTIHDSISTVVRKALVITILLNLKLLAIGSWSLTVISLKSIKSMVYGKWGESITHHTTSREPNKFWCITNLKNATRRSCKPVKEKVIILLWNPNLKYIILRLKSDSYLLDMLL